MRSFNDLIILKPREDLERKWNSSLIHTPDTALVSADALVGFQYDHAAIAEVFRVPEDCTTELEPGDGVVLPLFSSSKVVCIDGVPYLAAKKGAIAARVRNVGEPSEKLEALNGFVLTKRAKEEFEKHFNGGLLLTDDQVDDGIHCDGGSDGIVRLVCERTVSVGTAFLNPPLQKPKQRVGELVCFNPMGSCRFRRFGVNYRLTPNEYMQFALEE
jgi:hypothetical protein